MKMEHSKPNNNVNGLRKAFDYNSENSSLDIGEEELLGVCYFRAASITTKTLVEYLVAVLNLTFWAVNGHKSWFCYFRKKLHWKNPQMKGVFSPRERKRLKVSPIYYKPYGKSLNFKLLKFVFEGVSEDVHKQVQELERVPLIACHSPPQLHHRKHLWNHLHKLFCQQEKLRDCVVQFSLNILEKSLTSLYREQTKLKWDICEMFKHLVQCNFTLSCVTLNRAILTMERECHLQSVDIDIELNTISRMLETLHLFENQLMICEQKTRNVKTNIENIEKLYLAIIEKNILRDISVKLNDIGGSGVSNSDLKESYRHLLRLKHSTKDRLNVVGQSEVVSHYLSLGTSQTDVIKWLQLRKVNVLAVNKIYSHLKRSDTGELVTIEQLLQNNIPELIVLSGPIASGKTCLCHYLFHQWRVGNSSIKFLRKVDFVVSLTAEYVSSKSFIPYLKDKIFPKSLEGVHNTEVLAIFRQLKVFFIIDTGLSVTKPVLEAIKELAVSLGRNKMMITTRPEKRKWIIQIFKDAQLTPTTVTLEPLSELSVKEFCYDSSLKTLCPDGSSKVMELAEQILAEEREALLLYPLFISYMIFLGLKGALKNVSSFLDLFKALLDVSRLELKSKLLTESTASEKEILSKIKKQIKMLYNVASTRMLQDKQINTDFCSECFFPFLVSSGLSYSPKDHYKFLHPCVYEYLFACSIVPSLKSKKLKSVLKINPVENVGGRFIDTIKFICGEMSLRQNCDVSFAHHVVWLFKTSGVDATDYNSWVSLLHMSKWQSSLVKAVAHKVDVNMVLKVSCGNTDNVGSLCQLIKHGGYHPKEIIVTSDIPQQHVKALSSSTSVDFSILPAPGFVGISMERELDSMLKDLAKPRNVVELWGRLGEEGAKMLSTMTQLHTLHIHLFSLRALKALSISLRTCMKLRKLNLQLALFSEPPDQVPKLLCPTKTTVCLTLIGITEESRKWAVIVVKQLGCNIQQVDLTRTCLSPPQLHALKNDLRPIPIHTSSS